MASSGCAHASPCACKYPSNLSLSHQIFKHCNRHIGKSTVLSCEADSRSSNIDNGPFLPFPKQPRTDSKIDKQRTVGWRLGGKTRHLLIKSSCFLVAENMDTVGLH